MKKIIFLIIIASVLFSFSNAFSEDRVIGRTIFEMRQKIELNGQKLLSAQQDLFAIGKSIPTEEGQFQAILLIRGTSSEAGLIHKYMPTTAYWYLLIQKDMLKVYFSVVYETLMVAIEDLQHCYKRIQSMYSFVEKKSALHTIDKIKDILRDSILEIDRTLKIMTKEMNGNK